MLRIVAVVAPLVLLPSIASAQSCNDYPYTDGINIEEVKGFVRILSTSTVPVNGSDASALKAARTLAESQAQAGLHQFLKEDIRRKQSILQAIETTRSMGGDAYKSRVTAAETVISISGNARSLVRDTALFKLCGGKGPEFKATVVVKPEAMKRAIAESKGEAPPAAPSDVGSEAEQQPGSSGMDPNAAAGIAQAEVAAEMAE